MRFGSRSSCCGEVSQADCHSQSQTDGFWVGSAGCFQMPVTRSPSCGRRLCCAVIAPASDRTGAGNRDADPGRPAVSTEIRQLIREMSIANPLWGAPRIHGELLKLGIGAGQTSVAKYMASRRGPPSQGWKTFLRNHADGIAAMDLFVVPTASFRLLYGLLIVSHSRRRIVWLGVTAHPTAEWLANQLTQACGWDRGTVVPDPRPGCLLRPHIRSSGSISGHPRSPDVGTLPLAERFC